MPPDPNVKVGVAGVVWSSRGLLMIQRGGTGAYAADGHGSWSVPGGWLEYGETPQEAAEREVLEESGVRARAISDGGFVCCQSDSDPIQIVTLFVRCQYLGGEPTVTEPDKCPVVKWVPHTEVDRLLLFKPLKMWRAKRSR